MKKFYMVLMMILSIVSFQSYAQDCETQTDQVNCKVDMAVDSLIATTDLTQYKSQESLSEFANISCADLVVEGMSVTPVITEICLNKYSIAWMEKTLAVNNEKIEMLAQEIIKNNVSLEQMNSVILDKQEQLEALKQQ